MEIKKRKKSGYEKSVYRSLAMISQFGINMLVPIVMCSFVGIFLDRTFDTSYWMILLFFVGALAGFRNVYVFARRVYRQPPEPGYKKTEESRQKQEVSAGHKSTAEK